MQKELEIRLAAFQWLREREGSGGVIPGRELIEGFLFEGERITLKGPTGIWLPRGFRYPISITTVLDGPYRLDSIADDGILDYSYRGTDPNHRENRALREALRARTPLIYFKETRLHHFQAIWPVIILEDHPETLSVRASMDPAYQNLNPDSDTSVIPYSPLDLRRYAWTQTRQRLHQNAFRDLVISAYDERCAICRLNHPELLDAAHIIPDSDDRGTPVVQNGLSLCKIHHAAYDRNILGVDPDYRVRIREDILREHDGPMLRHGLQELDGSRLTLPTHKQDQPDRARLEERFRIFLSAS